MKFFVDTSCLCSAIQSWRLGFVLAFLAASSVVAQSVAPNAIVVKEGVNYRQVDHLGPTKQAVFSCVLKATGENYEIKRRPMSRHIKELGEPPFDISFPVPSQYALKAGERLSAPLALEEWYWVMRSKLENGVERPNNSNSTIAVISGSEEESWLLSSGVTNLKRVLNLDQLVKLFSTGRVDVLLIDRETLKELSLDMGLDITPYFFKFERYVSFSALFSAAIIGKKPDLLEAFNRQIPSCATEEVLLDPIQKVALEAYSREVYGWLVAREETRSLQSRPVKISRFDHSFIDSLEREWGKSTSSLRKGVFNNSLSKFLRAKLSSRFPFVSELLVFDRSGALVAASADTTDYYQGDEMKYTQTFSKNQNFYLDRLRFDESTGKFLVQVTMLIQGQGTGQNALGVTLGIDVTNFLASSRKQNQSK